MRAPPASNRPMIGARAFIAASCTLMIFCAWVSDSEPPNTVKSLANRNTVRPLTVPQPVTTPSPGILVFSMPKSVERCSTNMSNSSNEPLSSSSSMRSRAVSLPRLCCASMRACAAAGAGLARGAVRACRGCPSCRALRIPRIEGKSHTTAAAAPRSAGLPKRGRLRHDSGHEFSPPPPTPKPAQPPSRRRWRCTARASSSSPCSAMWRSCSRTRTTSTRSITSPCIALQEGQFAEGIKVIERALDGRPAAGAAA